MIQRLQSVFLLIATILQGLLFWEPIDFLRWKGAQEDVQSVQYMEDGIWDVYDSPILMGIIAFCSLLSLAAIFLYKNRKAQMSVVQVNGFVVVAFLVYSLYYVLSMRGLVSSPFALVVGAGLPFLVFALALIFLAIRYIRKDDRLVKSMDRLR